MQQELLAKEYTKASFYFHNAVRYSLPLHHFMLVSENTLHRNCVANVIKQG